MTPNERAIALASCENNQQKFPWLENKRARRPFGEKGVFHRDGQTEGQSFERTLGRARQSYSLVTRALTSSTSALSGRMDSK